MRDSPGLECSCRDEPVPAGVRILVMVFLAHCRGSIIVIPLVLLLSETKDLVRAAAVSGTVLSSEIFRSAPFCDDRRTSLAGRIFRWTAWHRLAGTSTHRRHPAPSEFRGISFIRDLPDRSSRWDRLPDRAFRKHRMSRAFVEPQISHPALCLTSALAQSLEAASGHFNPAVGRHVQVHVFHGTSSKRQLQNHRSHEH